MRSTEIWAAEAGEVPAPVSAGDPLWLCSTDVSSGGNGTPQPPDAVMLLPTKPTRRTCGVALVPDACTGRVLLNGVRLRPGMHVLRHADRVAMDGRAVWFAIAATPDEVRFDPEVHGDPVFCHRTKARLTEGDPMVICRGTPEADCGMMFTAAAWGAGLPCHSCGAQPGDRGWTPPSSERSGALAELLELVAEA